MPIAYQNLIFKYWKQPEKARNLLDKKTRDKVDWTIKVIEYHAIVPTDYFQRMKDTDGIWEIRIKLGSNIYRVFCFFDEDQLIVLENGFQKKSQKTPKNEIRRAERIKKEYFNENNPNIKSFDQHLDEQHGVTGTKSRDGRKKWEVL